MLFKPLWLILTMEYHTMLISLTNLKLTELAQIRKILSMGAVAQSHV